MATIKDVARLAGVSVSTISKYLNGGNVLEENAEAIRQAIAQLDYRVNPFARSLKTQKKPGHWCAAAGNDASLLRKCGAKSGPNLA